MLNRIFGIMGWVGTALVLAAVAARLIAPEQQTLWWWLSVSGLVVLLLYGVSQWREIVRIFGRRQARYGTLATSSVLLVLGIVVGLNYVLARQNKRWDLTAAGQYSLSDQTRRVLERLDAPIRVLVFAREDEFPRYRDRLDEYAYAANEVSVEYLDVDKQPVLAKQYEIQAYGTIVFEYQGRTERTTSDREQDLTNALIKVVEGRERKIYFVQGHGEKDIESSDRGGYSALSDALKRDNFGVEKLVLAQAERVPEDASLVVVAGPQTDLLPPETDRLREYLTRGGKLVLLLDPRDTPDAPRLDGLVALAREWGIEVGDNVVVDASGIGQLLGTDASVPVAATYPPHPINERFNLLTAYPLARSVKPATGDTGGRTAQSFVETSARSWAESSLAELAKGQVELNEDRGDLPGPISIAAAVSAPVDEPEKPAEAKAQTETNEDGSAAEDENAAKPETRVVVFGDSDFPSNAALGVQGNRDLALNALNWAAQQENLISIRPREPEDRRITLTADQQRRVNLLSIFMIPGVVLGLGVYTWWRRR